eukprot:1127378-Amphidinium_carterae.2
MNLGPPSAKSVSSVLLALSCTPWCAGSFAFLPSGFANTLCNLGLRYVVLHLLLLCKTLFPLLLFAALVTGITSGAGSATGIVLSASSVPCQSQGSALRSARLLSLVAPRLLYRLYSSFWRRRKIDLKRDPLSTATSNSDTCGIAKLSESDTTHCPCTFVVYRRRPEKQCAVDCVHIGVRIILCTRKPVVQQKEFDHPHSQRQQQNNKGNLDLLFWVTELFIPNAPILSGSCSSPSGAGNLRRHLQQKAPP